MFKEDRDAHRSLFIFGSRLIKFESNHITMADQRRMQN